MLRDHGHDVVSIDRSGAGYYWADISDMASLARVSATRSFDAVACAAGDVFPAPLEQTTDEQWAQSIAGKGIGQINVVRAVLPHIAAEGSFTSSSEC